MKHNSGFWLDKGFSPKNEFKQHRKCIVFNDIAQPHVTFKGVHVDFHCIAFSSRDGNEQREEFG